MSTLFAFFPTKSGKKPEPESKSKGKSTKKETTQSAKEIIKNVQSTKKVPSGKGIVPNFKAAITSFSYADVTKHEDLPPHHGEVNIPTGAPGCLAGLKFLVTGTMDSLKREELVSLITQYGGEMVQLVKKADICIRGCCNVTRKTLDLAVSRNLTIIDEKSLLTAIAESDPNNSSQKPLPALVLPPNSENSDPESSPKVFYSDSGNLTVVDSSDISRNESQNHHQQILDDPQEPPKPTKFIPSPYTPPPPVVHTLFTEKYRPSKTTDLVGNDEAVKLLRRWISTFDTQQKKAVLISGPPGIGKTTTAEIIAREAGYHVLELNASDTRSKAAIESFGRDSVNNNTIMRYNSGQPVDMKTCFIFDEVDGMSTGDRGGISALGGFIEKTQIPIICICNNRDGKKLQPILKFVTEVVFKLPDLKSITARLCKILEEEHIDINRKQMIELTQKCGGDIRSAINTLQFWANGISQVDAKDLTLNDPCAAAQKIVTSIKPMELEEAMTMYYVDYEMTPAYAYEMMNMQTTRIGDWAAALDSLSMGDVMSNSIHADGNWNLLDAYGVTSLILPATLTRPKFAVQRTYKPAFPAVIYKTATKTKNEKMMIEIASHCCRATPMGRAVFRMDVGDVIIQRYTKLLAEGKKDELLEFLDTLELTKDNVETLKGIVDMGKGTFVEADAKNKRLFTQLYQASHGKAKGTDSGSSQKENFYIKTFGKK